MKKFIFGLIAAGLVAIQLLTTMPVYGTAISGIIALTNRTAIITNACHLNSLTIYNTGTNNTLFSFFDAPGTTNLHSANAIALGQTNSLFTNFTYSASSVSNANFTNIYGVITTNFYLTIGRTTNNVSATLALYQNIANLNIASNAFATITFGSGQFNNFGLMMTNLHCPVGGVFWNVDYDNKR